MKNLIFLIFIFVFSCQTKNENVQENATQKTEISDDCQNCGMPSLPFPKWNVIAKTSTKTAYFCSPRCMFAIKFKNDLKADSVLVSDFYDLQRIEATKAFYVIESDILGSMGHDLVPLKSKTDAETFLKEHKGSKILTFEQVNLQTITDLAKKQ